MRKHINAMKLKEFYKVQYRECFDSKIECSSLVILPTKKMHDSGYRCMDFVAVDKHDYPICRCSGCSDVLRLYNSIHYQYPTLEKLAIDCLPKSGLLRVFADDFSIIGVGAAISDMILYKAGEQEFGK